jgi:hypothetical protein
MMYRRVGLNVNSMNNPIHEVVWYRYIRFRPDRTVVSLYTNATPKRFLPKYIKSIKTAANSSSAFEEEKPGQIAEQLTQSESSTLTQQAPQITLQTGTYVIQNDYLTLTQMVGDTEYRYEF